MTENEAIRDLEYLIEECSAYPPETGVNETIGSLQYCITALREIQQYRKIGTVEECKKAVKEEDALKFYYCESEDDYYIGKRAGNFYYARYGETGFEWFMSRYLPWGKHVIAPNTLWKEYIYPSEPKEIPFFEWLQGFIKRYCGGTVEDCREAVEKQKPKKPKEILRHRGGFEMHHCPNCDTHYQTDNRYTIKDNYCPVCGKLLDSAFRNYCGNCGQAIDENLEGMEDE